MRNFVFLIPAFLIVLSSAHGCQKDESNPTKEELCNEVFDAICQRIVACGSLQCVPTGELLTNITQCRTCANAAEFCRSITDANKEASKQDMEEADQCNQDLGVASCDDLGNGVYPSSCQ